MRIFTAGQIKEWDAFTIENEPIASVDLMERAATECTTFIMQHIQAPLYKIFCGKGNNGGDGLAIARQLAIQHKVVHVYILEFGKPGTSDFQENLQRLHAYDVSIQYIQHESSFPQLSADDTIIECLYGSGLNRPLDGLSASLVQHINDEKCNVVSIDVPAGMYTDRSSLGNVMIKANQVLTFQRLKLCFLLAENEQYAQAVTVLNIGLQNGFNPEGPDEYHLVNDEMAKKIYKPRQQFSHKGTFGHALIVAGSKGKMGACILSSRSCLRSGAGLITAAVPGLGLPIIQTAFAEAMAITFDQLTDFNWESYQAMGVGPGLGTNDDAAKTLALCLHQFKKPMVIDADGLNILSKNLDWLKQVPAQSILTPHPKEFERLFGKGNNNVETIQLALQNAKAHQLIIVLKGHYTFIATPGGRGYFNTTGNNGMATAGTGDVLTGIITGLLAQGYVPEDAAMFGVYLHGLAGDIAAQRSSAESMLAGDLVENIGMAYQKINKHLLA